MKRCIKLLLGIVMAGSSLLGCSKGKKNPDAYDLNYKKSNGAYHITVSRYGHTISTFEGSIGVRFDKNEFRADEPIYSNYKSVSKLENGLLAKGEISSAYGTTIEFTDFFVPANDRVIVNREFEVKKAGEDYGFMVEQKWTSLDKGQIHEKEWFIPSTYYVNGSHTFDKIVTRSFFDGEELIIPADDVSALIVSSLQDNFSFGLLDTTPGYRETIGEDYHTADSTYLYINKDFNFAGIIISNSEDNKTTTSHIYPSFSRKARDKYYYRLLPVEEGFKRQISFEIFLEKHNTYNDMYQSMWQNAYQRFKYADKRYKLNDIYHVLREFVRRSYSELNMWGNLPQYMTNADHYFPDSGFLYRNLEMGTFMLRYGRELNDAETINNALTVINYQIDNDCIDMKMRAYNRDNSVFKRILFDGLASVVDLYIYLVNSNYNDTALINKFYNYIVEKAELYKDSDSLLAISFYSRLYVYKDILFLDYKDVATRYADLIAEQTKEYDGYYGAVENTDPNISVAEDYMLMLRGMMNVYEASKDHKYLKEADRLAKYLQTFSMVQPINMNPVGSTGAEGLFSGFIGNERFLGYGYSFNNTAHHILDCPTVGSTIEYHKLYKYTNNSIFNEYLESKLYNSLLYVNMGDKIGYMDDTTHSAGDGYINEFVGNSTISENAPEHGVRGAVHDSILGWNIYEILYALQYLKDANYEGFNDDYKLTHDLAKNKVISINNDNIAHSVYNTINGLSDTYYVSEEDSEFVLDLNEQCYVESIKVTADSDVKVMVSSDDVSFDEISNLQSINSKIRYVKFAITKGNKVSNIEINGYPVKYDNLAVSATIVDESGSMAYAIDKSNYATSWSAGDNTSAHTIVLDLNEEAEIYETAIKFNKTSKYSYKIETSLDGVNYTQYSFDDGTVDKYVFVSERFIKARYVKLTILSSAESSILVKDFKVLGSR